MQEGQQDLPDSDELVSRIFQHFDSNNAGLLDQGKLQELIRAFNQEAAFTDKQLEAIVAQICEEYSQFSTNGGLTKEGLAQIYQDGISNLENDFNSLGLDKEPELQQPPVASADKVKFPLAEVPGDEMEAESIDFEPERQSDSFTMLTHLKSAELPLDAQSDTAMSIEPRIDSTLADTPKHSRENLVLEALEGSLGLHRSISGAESIQELAAELPKGEDAQLHGSTPHRLPSALKLPAVSPSERLPSRRSNPSSPLNLKLRSPTGEHVAEIVHRLEGATSPLSLVSPRSPGRVQKPESITDLSEKRSVFFTPLSEKPASLDGAFVTPGEKRKKSSVDISPRPPKHLREVSSPEVELFLSPEQRVFDVKEGLEKEEFKRRIQENADQWAKASPGWSTLQAHQTDIHVDATHDFATSKFDSSSAVHVPKLPLSNPLSKRLIHNLSTDSRGSACSTIQAHMHSPETETTGLEYEENDDVFDETIGPTGQVLKFPSAISIEDRHSSLKRDYSLASTSRMASGASEILEDRPELHVEVPLEINRIVEGSHPYNPSPGSTSVAEKEAQVGYESLDSQDFASFTQSPNSPARAGLQFKESPVKLMRAEMMSLLQIKPSSRLVKAFQAKIESRCSKSEVYDLHMELGRLLVKMGNHKDAVSSYKIATDITEDNPQTFLRLGNCLFALDRFTEAESAFKRGLQVADADRDSDLMMKTHTNLGITLEAMGLLVSACTHYRKAAELAPTHARAFKLLGGAHYALGNLELAKFELEKAIALDSQYADAYCDLGCCLCGMGDIEEAKDTFKKALKHDTKHVEGWFNLGNLERQSGEFKAALQCYQWVLHLEPKHWRALLNSAVAFIGLNRPHEAQTALQKALKLTGNHKAVADEIKHVDSMSQEGATLADLQDTASTITSKMVDVPSPIKDALKGQRPDRPSGSGEEASEVSLNHALLKKLSGFCKVPVNKLHARAQAHAQVAVLTHAEAEVICHTLLQNLKPRAFTALMSCMLQHVLPTLEKQSQHTTSPGSVDRMLFLGLLIVLSQGTWDERLEALTEALSEGQEAVPLRNASAFVAAAKAIFTFGHAKVVANKVNFNQELKTSEAVEAYLMSTTSGMPALKELGMLAIQD